MASRNYEFDISEALRKLRRTKNSNVCYSVRKYREDNPLPLRDRSSYSSQKSKRF